MDDSFYIVGIGASAGGLEAVSEFFSHLPENSGMAFVVIQHLSPDFKSMMSELLAKYTRMPIQVVREDLRVRPNHVYLLSPENNVILEGGVLRPVGRPGRQQINLPIDDFFSSLANECKEKAVGIILSGTGTDGSRGIRTIKECGGLVLVQDPASARFDGMPVSALETGQVDSVLSAADLAEAVLQLTAGTEDGSATDGHSLSERQEKHFQEILDALFTYSGVKFSDYRRSTLHRRIEKRMFLRQRESLAGYLQLLEEDPDEIGSLYKELLIGVTHFFRDREAFSILRREVIPALVAEKPPEESIRIWVLGCATGEEAYSLAILVEDYLAQHKMQRTYKVYGSDLDSRAIQQANAGVYDESSMQEVSQSFRRKYFEATEDGRWAVNKNIREKVLCTVHDALQDPPFINNDLISCRNLLIYLKPEAQQKMLSNFQFALRENGYLMMGPSESIGRLRPAFRTVSDRWKIYQNQEETKSRSASQLWRPALLPRPLLSLPNYLPEQQEQEAFSRLREKKFDKFLLGRFAPLCLFVNDRLEVLHIHGDADRYFTFPRNPGNFNLGEMLGESELLLVRNGVRKVLENRKSILYRDAVIEKKNQRFQVDLQFEPASLEGIEDALVMISLQEQPEEKPEAEAAGRSVSTEDYPWDQLEALETGLRYFREENQLLVERLETANEELQASNEELLAANEELQSMNEELQAVNEEVYIVNSELQEKIHELEIAGNDINNLLRATEIGTIFVDQELRIRKFTPAIRKQFNLQETDLGRPINIFVNSFGTEMITQAFRRVLNRRQKIEQKVSDQEGNHYLMRLLPYRQEDGEVGGVVATFVDLSELDQENRNISVLADRYRAIFNYTDDAIMILDEETVIQDVNIIPPNMRREDIVGRKLYDLLPEDLLGQTRKWVDQARQTGKIAVLNSKYRVEDEERQRRSLLIPIQHADGKTEYFVISRNETQLRSVEKEIRKKAEIFNNLYRLLRHHIMILDADGIMRDINFTAAGYRREDLIGKDFREVGPPESGANVRKALDEIHRGAEYVTYESDIFAPDSQRHWYRHLVFPIRQEDRLEEIIYLTQDITEQRLYEKSLREVSEKLEAQVFERSEELQRKNLELAEMNNYLDSFVHGAAHDLRGPLTQMKGFLNILPEVRHDEDRSSILEEFGAAIHRMERILNGLIELIDFKQDPSHAVKKINVRKIYREVLQDLRPLLETTEADITEDLPPDLEISYIEAYLTSILYNLLHNAIKYRAYNRPLKINVAAAPKNGYVTITVRDNGIGMDLQRYGHFLFKPFKRLTVEREGTGVGLSLINNIVNRYGGYIEVDSRLDEGAVFRVFLRAMPVAAPVVQSPVE